ncbi:uncharacterized protein LOC127137594 [Lathyrus oleraceus]|uniref:uncharacterized protein LOC127137594 n=1 Tax=Pisum sativum TaxID=3888 RepID=UPI0021CDFBF1|nr:uncharacterized protein LOC127137594 [Pisum sativum]
MEDSRITTLHQVVSGKLNLEVSSMIESMVSDTSVNGLVTISFMCLNCHATIYGKKDFGIDLICLPLSQLDVVLGMNGLKFNRVYINCFGKTVLFPELEDSMDSRFVSASQVEMSLREDDQVLVMFASLRVESDVVASDMHVVCEFPGVFPEDICDLPTEREVEFTIDLVLPTRPVSMTPYKMSTSELSELKIQLEGLLEKEFVRPSVLLWGTSVLLVKKKDGNMRLCVDYR